MKKRLLSVLLCLCLALALVPTVPAQAASVITITAQPTTLTLAEGDSISFSVTATVSSGYTLAYQWQTYNTYNAQISDFADITDATEAKYTAGNMTSFSHGFAYRCKLMALNSDKEVVETVYTNTVYLYLSGSTSHVHSWSSDWSSDETYHWHECIADNCNYTLNNVKDGYVDHTFVWVDNGDNTHSWVCSVCGYVETENQNHSFGEQVEQGDENGHWVVCECGAYYRLGAHTYGAPTFNWAENYSTATASFSCSTCGYPVTVDCEVESVTTDVTCEEDGKTVYTATATFNGAEYTDTQTVTEEGTATGHSYGEPTFNWAEDYSTATAAFTCSGCSNVLEVGCGVTSSTTAATCTADAYTVYTASVSLDGTPYTDTQTVTEENTATGHSYGAPDFTWAGDNSTATAAFTCEACSDVQTVECDVTSATTDAKCEEDGKTVYTATVTFNEQEYTETQTVTIAATGHSYGEPDWEWNDDKTEATATFACDNCEETVTVTANTSDTVNTITSEITTDPGCTTTGIRTYTATVEFQGETYEGTLNQVEPATGHSYETTWTSDETGHWHECSVCGDVTDKAEHIFGDWTDNLETTMTQSRSCSVCDYTETRVLYTVTVDADEGGTVSTTSANVAVGEEITLSATASEGYEFAGWKANDGSTVSLEASYTFTVTGDTSLAATFRKLSYTVTVSGSYADATGAGTYEWGKTVTLDAGTNTGYLFTGWTSNSEEVTFDDISAQITFTMPKGDVAVTANWALCDHGGGGDENNTSCTDETTCSQCGGTVAATGHSYGETQYIWAEADGGYTCTASRTCTVCNDTETAHGTVIGEQTIDPTCTEKGEMTYTATFSDCEWAKEQTATADIAPTGHTYGEPVFAWADDYSTATAAFTCEAGDNTVKLECEVTSRTTAASCTVAGETVYTAAVTFGETEYTETQTVAIPAAGHSWGDWETVTSPTCEDEGSERRVCAVCGLTETQGVDAAGHSWETEYTIDQAATCTTDGSQSIHCASCDAVKDSEVIPATGHSYEETVVAPTYTEEGYTLHTCTVCGHSYTTDPTPVLTVVIGETDEEEVKVETRTNTEELTAVPETLTTIYSTVEELTEDLTEAVVSRVSASVSYTENNVTVHDVTLQYQINDGDWIDATEENFPAAGITVTLPYPEGSGMDDDFVVVHMFTVTSEKLGTVAGEVEYPAVTKTADGLVVTLKGLSPVAIAWTEGETTNTTSTATATPAATAQASPATGDDMAPALWLALLAITGCGLTAIAVMKKKKSRR